MQGVGGAIVTPLTLTILSDAVPIERRGIALGLWGGVSGLGVALGPLVGGAVVQGLSWQWIFWLNVPIGLAVIPLGMSRLRESYGPPARLDVTGVGLITASALGLVWGLVRANSRGWTSPEIVAVAGGRRRPPGRVRRLGAAGPRADAADAASSGTAPSRLPTPRRS